MTRRTALCLLVLLAACLTSVLAAAAAEGNWAAAEIRTVTRAGVLGTSSSTFAPQRALSEGALAAAIAATDAIQHPPAPPPPSPPPPDVTSSIGPNATIGGLVTWAVDAPGRQVARVDFAVDGSGIQTSLAAPFEDALETHALADGPHRLAVRVSFVGGGAAIATWSIAVANTSAAPPPPTAGPVSVPVARFALPPTPVTPEPRRVLYRAVSPAAAVTVKHLDAALVAYLGLGGAAREIQSTLADAGLEPPAGTGTEGVARLLGLRLNHPAAEDGLELLPNAPATRAEAAWSFARILQLDPEAVASVQQAADAFTLPTLTPWQRRLLRTAISYVGYPYVWGGTSPTAETDFGVRAPGGFDCSGFVWRVVKLTEYAGGRRLANVLRGRTTYVMSGEVPRRDRIPIDRLQPADVLFFGAHGRRSKPSEVDHTALYLGNGWFVQSSDEGVTLLPLDGWYARSFAWARRPLREAGLAR